MAMTQCKECGKDISDQAAACPYCGCPSKASRKNQRKNTPLSIFVMLLSLLFLFICAWFVFSPNSSFNQTGSKSEVTLSHFNAINSGMTYKQVCEILGEDGTLQTSVDLGIAGTKTEIYSWVGAGDSGANCNVTFQSDQVIAKSQAGLK